MRVIVVGGGFTGTMTAVHLARLSRGPVRITLVERGARFAAGVAYSTPHACHLLNVPAGRMTALPEDEEHFLRWAVRRDPSVKGGAFLPRMVYSEYIADILSEAAAGLKAPSALERVSAEVVSVHPDLHGGGAGLLEVRCADGRVLAGDAVVLAIGNYPPASPRCETMGFYESTRYWQDPWAPGAMDVGADADVLLLGTGLTMIDVAVVLLERGHRGRLHCLSRRGLLPQTHRETAAAPPHLAPPEAWKRWPGSAMGICREVRREVARAERDGVDWRDVVTSLRSVTCDLWRSLPQGERRRFLTHLRPFFETHRHRTAPEIGRRIEAMRESGQLNVIAGRVMRYDERAGGGAVEVTFRRRGQERVEAVRVARVINCTGPDTDLSRVREPLVQDLRDRGMIRPDALGLGLDTDEGGRVIDVKGGVHERLYLAGPLRRGQLWENIAVPELREEAVRLAKSVLARQGGGAAS